MVEYDLDSRDPIAIGFEDGTVRREPFVLSEDRRPDNIRHYRVDFAAGLLALRLPNGQTATVELAVPGIKGRQLMAGRFIVYLDQNLWSRVAARPLRSSPRGSAARPLRAPGWSSLVADRRIIVPVSSRALP